MLGSIEIQKNSDSKNINEGAFISEKKDEIDKDFISIKKENNLDSMPISNIYEYENYNDKQKFILNNWYETCCIYDEFDIHDVFCELKAVGLPVNMANLTFDGYTNIEIIILK